MATSFAIPGQPCSVGQFEQAEREGRIQSSWKDYCDCMFQYVDTVQLPAIQLWITWHFDAA